MLTALFRISEALMSLKKCWRRAISSPPTHFSFGMPHFRSTFLSLPIRTYCVALRYVIRVASQRLLNISQLCPRFCLVCHQQLQEDLDALKPYVCSSKLCTYQYYNLNRGPSLEARPTRSAHVV